MKPTQVGPILTVLTSIYTLSSVEVALGVTTTPTPSSQVGWSQLSWSQNRLVLVSTSRFEEGVKKQEQEDYSGAIADYTEFIKTHPDHLESYSNRGFAKAMQNDLQGALSDFDRAIELAPHNADAYNARGNVNAMAGNLAASIRDFNQSIRCNRDFADAYYNRAISRHGLGDRRGAKSDLSQAARLFQQQKDAGGYQQAKEWMNKLR